MVYSGSGDDDDDMGVRDGGMGCDN